MDGVNGLLNHERVGVRKIKAVLNGKLELVGLLPTIVEPTPFQRANFVDLVQRYGKLLIAISDKAGEFALIPSGSPSPKPRRHGEVLWEMKKTAARDAWKEIETSIATIARIVTADGDRRVVAA